MRKKKNKKLFSIICILLLVVGCISLINNFNDKGMSNSNSNPNQNISSSKETDFTKLKMGCLGDSITYGVDGTNGTIMENPYSKLVKEELKLKEVYNYGVNGTTYCLNNLGRQSLVDNYKIMEKDLDIISVFCGVNDYDQSLPLGTKGTEDLYTLYGAVNYVAKGLKELYPNSFIFFITPYNTTWKNNTIYDLVDVVNIIKDVANTYNIPLLDMYTNGNYEVEMNNENSDGLHPSQQFIKQYTTPQIVEFIKLNYK